jgi:hypothetical protein
MDCIIKTMYIINLIINIIIIHIFGRKNNYHPILDEINRRRKRFYLQPILYNNNDLKFIIDRRRITKNNIIKSIDLEIHYLFGDDIRIRKLIECRKRFKETNILYYPKLNSWIIDMIGKAYIESILISMNDIKFEYVNDNFIINNELLLGVKTKREIKSYDTKKFNRQSRLYANSLLISLRCNMKNLSSSNEMDIKKNIRRKLSKFHNHSPIYYSWSKNGISFPSKMKTK